VELGPAGEADIHRENGRTKPMHSTPDPDARLFKKAKGHEARLDYVR
jgi:hypothetical protein